MEESFTTLWIYTILKLIAYNVVFVVVLLPYGFTLFSNKIRCSFSAILCFTTLWIYTILKLVTKGAAAVVCFTTLWIYTILKQSS